MPSIRKTCFCVYCDRKHRGLFYSLPGEESSYFCDAGRSHARRELSLSDPMTPCFVEAISKQHRVDATGHLICALDYRGDVRALISMSSLCGFSSAWRQHAIFFTGFGLQLYWIWPMMSFYTAVCGFSPMAVTRGDLMAIAASLSRRYNRRRCRVVRGALLAGSGPGLFALKNPSERRSGLFRFRALAREIDVWKDLSCQCRGLLRRGHVLPLEPIVSVLRGGATLAFGHAGYGFYRLVRSLFIVSGARHADTPEDWYAWRTMSTHLRKVTEAKGLWEFQNAMLWRDSLRVRLRLLHDSLSDLTCFICSLWPERVL